MVAYDKNTGAVKWKTEPLGPVGYVSPTIIKIDGADHVVMVTASQAGGFPGGPQVEPKKGSVVGMEPLTGKILWCYDDWECHIPMASPTDAGQNRLLVVGGYERGATLLLATDGAKNLYLIEPDPAGYKQIAKAELLIEQKGDDGNPGIRFLLLLIVS